MMFFLRLCALAAFLISYISCMKCRLRAVLDVVESCGALITSHPQLLILTIGCPYNVSPQSEISSCIGCIFLKLSPAWLECMWWWLDCGAPSSLTQQLLISNMRCLNLSLQRRFPVLKTSSAWWMWWWLGCGGPISLPNSF